MSMSEWLLVLVAVIGAVANYVQQREQNQIFREQNQIFADQGGKKVPPKKPNWIWLKRYWPSMVTVLLILSVGYDIYDRHHQAFGYNPNLAWDDKKPLERVYQGAFANQTVLLDGKNFINPSFENVTLAYNGTGPFMIEDPTRFVNVQIATRNKVVGEAFRLHCIFVRSQGCNTTCTNRGPNGRPDIPSFPE
jgi:hypothetical protein